MNLIFAGTSEFAARALEALAGSGHRIVAVLTQPDRPSGRGLAATASPVKRLALARDIPLEQPASLKDPATQQHLQALDADALVVAAYGLILPQAVLDKPRLGAINIHASLLPRWRGAAPIQRALLAGDSETGVTIMKMDAGLDTGPILASEALPIRSEDTGGSLHDRLAELGAQLIVTALDAVAAGTIVAIPQPTEGVTYAAKIDKREARIDWSRAAPAIERQIRAFNPHPGASARIRGVELKLWRSIVAPGVNAANEVQGSPGDVLQVSGEGVRVACGAGTILLTELQRAGARRLPAAEFLRGFPVAAGERFTPPG